MGKPLTANWKDHATRTNAGYYDLKTEDTRDVPVRIFLTPQLFGEAEDAIYGQIVNATRFPGVKMVVLTPDAHIGSSVPVGCVIITDGTLAMGPVGYDIGCGVLSARSDVVADAATPRKRLEFNREVMARVVMGTGGGDNVKLGKVVKREFEEMVRGGVEAYQRMTGSQIDRSRAEINRHPVDDGWEVPWGGRGRPERGVGQLGSLGAGNHFMELQRCIETDTLFVMLHTGSRGFGHGLATNYLALAKQEHYDLPYIELGYFTPNSPNYQNYRNAIAAGANYAMINRMMLFEQIAVAFRRVFRADLELIYEISHNLAQPEWHPDFGDVWVHRKGATRAFPAAHPALDGTQWHNDGHPVLIPGSNKDFSYILRPRAGAAASGYSVNHGAGRKMSRGEATQRFTQRIVDRQYKEAGIVVNADGKVPIDESGACYKSSADVIAAVTDAGLAEIEYTLWPMASLKGKD